MPRKKGEQPERPEELPQPKKRTGRPPRYGANSQKTIAEVKSKVLKAPPIDPDHPPVLPVDESGLLPGHRAFIVGRLAAWVRPRQVVEELKELYGLNVPMQTVTRYDPETAQGAQTMAQDLKDLFWEIRAKAKSAVSDIPIANTRAQLLMLQEQVELHWRNPQVVASMIELANKIQAGAWTRTPRLEVTGKDGTPLIDLDSALKTLFANLSDDELDELAPDAEAPAGS